jgi:hypothetical protein
MENEETTITPANEETPNPERKGGFRKGRVKTGGRPKKSEATAKLWDPRAIAESAKFKGIESLIEVFRTGKLPVTAAGRVAQDASPAQRIDCLKQACSYLFPRLATTEVTGPDNGPLAMNVSTLDVTKLMENSELAQAAQRVALGLIYPPKQLEGGEDR